MKIRDGFVSNSSSSSFIIGLKETPKSYEDFKVMLLGDEADYPVVSHWNRAYATDRVVKRIYSDFMDKINNECIDGKSAIQYIRENFRYRLIDEIDKYTSYINNDDLPRFEELIDLIKINNKERDVIWEKLKLHSRSDNKYVKLEDELNKYLDELFEIFYNGFKKKYDDIKIIFDISYSDNDGELDSCIEHSSILNNVTLLYFNNH